jgi:hypothetical protein
MSAAKLSLVDPSQTIQAHLIDRLGLLNAILDDYSVQIAPFAAEAEALEAKILENYRECDPSGVYTDEGGSYRLKVGAMAESQQLDVAARGKVFREIGKAAYLASCKPTFEFLKTALEPLQYMRIVTKLRVGKRTIKTVVKAAPEPIRVAA